MQIGVLGPLTVGGEVAGLPRRDRVVLAALAMQAGEVVRAERLADALWGDHPPRSSVKVVQGCITRLRRVLGADAIETAHQGYRLRVPADDVDSHRFERLVHRGRELLGLGEPSRAWYVLGEALALWRGPALVDLEEWDAVTADVRRLDELRCDAEELQLDAALRLGRHREVLATARVLVEQVPLRERRWALLALAHYQGGQQADALRALHEARTVLARELGLDPGPDLVALEDAILRHDPVLAVADGLPDPRPTCPYRGLLPYDLADADDFFGRGRDIAACRDRLTQVGAVVVVGPSGSGKSSLVRAGLAAALQREGHRVVVVTPGPHPMDVLSTVPEAGKVPVLVVDQAEEAVGLCTDLDERTAFFAALSRYPDRGLLIVAVRADRLGDLSAHPGFTRLVERSLYLLNPMTPEDLRTAIEGPARGTGLRLEPGLVDLLVREVEGEPGALPLLSHALRATWERREADTLTVGGYTATGGVRGAVARSAETVYEQVPTEQRPALRGLLLRLVTPTPDGDPMRSRLPRRLLAGTPDNDRLVETLVAARLLTSDDGVIELAHEALVRAWPRLHDWLDEDAEGQRILRHLVLAADTWQTMGRPDSELYRGPRLTQALDWHDRTSPELTPTERDFLDAGRRLAEQEEQAAARRAEQQRRINRRLRTLLAGVAVLTVVALIATGIALDQRRDANRQRNDALRQRNEAVALSLASASRDAVDSNAALAVALAAESSAATEEPLREATAALVGARLALGPGHGGHPVGGPLVGHTGDVVDVAFDKGGRLLASVGDEGAGGTVRLWNLAEHQPHGDPLPGHFVTFGPQETMATVNHGRVQLWDVDAVEPIGKPIRGDAVTFDPERRVVVTAGRDGMIRFREPISGERVREALAAGTRAVTSLTFSPDGGLLAAAGSDRAVRVWDAATGDRVGQPIILPSGFVESVVFGPDGELLATLSGDGPRRRVQVWDVATSRPLTPPLPGDEAMFASTGDLLATMTSTRVHVWEARTGRAKLTLPAHQAVFDPDGSILVAAMNRGGALWLVDPTTGDVVREPLTGLTAPVYAMSFTPGPGAALVTAGGGGSLQTWDVARRGRVARTLTGHTGPVWSVAFDPDGRLLASGGGDGQVRLWNPETGEPAGRPLTGHRRAVNVVAFSPDGRLLASGSDDGTVRLWDPDTGDPVGQPIRDGDAVNSLAFSPDGRLIAYATYVGTVRMWSIATGRPVGEPLAGYHVSYSPHGDLLATTDNGGVIRLWDGDSRRLIGPALRHLDDGILDSVSFGPGGDVLASAGDDHSVRLWDPDGGEPLGQPMLGHTAPVTMVTFHPEGRLLASTSEDGTVRLWDARSGEGLGPALVGHDSSAVHAAAFSSGAGLLATAGGNGTVRVYDALWDADEGCRVAAHQVSSDQMDPFLPSGWGVTCRYLD